MASLESSTKYKWQQQEQNGNSFRIENDETLPKWLYVASTIILSKSDKEVLRKEILETRILSE